MDGYDVLEKFPKHAIKKIRVTRTGRIMVSGYAFDKRDFEKFSVRVEAYGRGNRRDYIPSM